MINETNFSKFFLRIQLPYLQQFTCLVASYPDFSSGFVAFAVASSISTTVMFISRADKSFSETITAAKKVNESLVGDVFFTLSVDFQTQCFCRVKIR